MIKMMKAVIRKLIMIKLKKIKMKIFLILLKLLLLQKASNQKLRFYQTKLAFEPVFFIKKYTNQWR